MKYERFTQWTENGASLILDNPQNENEARTQLRQKFKLACNKLAELEDKMEQGTLKEIPEGAVVLTKEEYDELKKCEYNSGRVAKWLTYFDEKEREIRKEISEKFAKMSKQRLSDKLHRGKALHTTVFGKEYVRRIFKEVVDEIAKEITEGKDDDTSEVSK